MTETAQIEYLKFPFIVKYYKYVNKDNVVIVEEESKDNLADITSEPRNLTKHLF